MNADLGLPVSSDPADYWTKGDHAPAPALPREWSEEFAHYLGWLIGDGSTSGTTVATIYGSAEDRERSCPATPSCSTGSTASGRSSSPSRPTARPSCGWPGAPSRGSSRPSACIRSRVPRRAVPWSIEQAPAEMVAAFLRGLFDADGCVVTSRDKGRYVGLGFGSPELLRGVQKLLSTFGIMSRIYKTTTASSERVVLLHEQGGRDGTYGHSAAVRPAHHVGVDRQLRPAHRVLPEPQGGAACAASSSTRPKGPYAARTHGASAGAHQRRCRADLQPVRAPQPLLRRRRRRRAQLLASTCTSTTQPAIWPPSTCSSSSTRTTDFDIEGFKAGVAVVFTGQEIIVGNADYPTEKIGETTRRLPPAGHRLRQHRRAAHGPGPAL